jgi:transcriptional regulator with XRE-family HTH domain
MLQVTLRKKGTTMAQIDIEPSGRFSTALKAAIEASNMSLTELAQAVDSTYEHMRKLVGGKAHPSIHLLRALAIELKADKDEWAELIEADKLHKRFKHLPKFLNQSADLEVLQPLFPQLTKQNQDFVVQTVRTLIKQQKAQAAR